MKKWPFIVAVGAIGIAGLALRERSKSRTGLGVPPRELIKLVSRHPATFGMLAGLGNGILATIRNKPVSLAATVVTALVIGISEGMLVANPRSAFETATFSVLGSMVGMAPFTRFDPATRALIENPRVPAPA